MADGLSTGVRLAGLTAASAVRRYIATLDVRVAHYDRSAEPSRPEFARPVILSFWHEYILVPFALWGGCNIAVLTSRHRDADWLASMARYLGYRIVRGSTTRGGAAALRELKKISRSTTIAITPDGPQGPRRTMSSGPIFLSSRLGLPLVPSGLGYDRPWRLKTWDRFALPRPFSRARILVGPPMHIPPRIDRDGLEHYRRQAEEVSAYLTEGAEQWAISGERLIGQREFLRRPPPIGNWAEADAAPHGAIDDPPLERRRAA